MDRLEEVEEANIDEPLIDARPPGIRIVFNSGSGPHSPQIIADALLEALLIAYSLKAR